MSDCCSKSNQKFKRQPCPENNKEYGEVPFKTILHHLKTPWDLALKEQIYYFCSDPDCGVVYFGEDNSIIHKNQLRTKVGVKETSDDALICYCFDVSRATAQINVLANKKAKAFVVEQTKKSLCSCTTRNPSGKCCLKDFPKQTLTHD